MSALRPAIVTNADRDWAVRQKPSWARRGDLDENAFGEIVDDGGWLDGERGWHDDDKPNWDQFVAEQAERFEKYFEGEMKTYADWSNLWRFSWWPKANPERRFPMSAPKQVYPFFREGSIEFERALKVATDGERMVWKRFGVAQFKPDDPRLKRVQMDTTPGVRGKMAAAGGE